MNLTREEAVAALRDVEGAEQRTVNARAYRFGAPHLFLWGAVWVVGYTLTGVVPGRAIGPVWWALSLIGVGGAVLLNRARLRAAGGTETGRRAWFWLAGWAIVWLFVAATYLVMRPASGLQYQVFPALVLGLVYGLVGAWGKPRYLLIGVAVAGLALAGYLLLPSVLPFWLAAVGGGGLIVGGLWLRRA